MVAPAVVEPGDAPRVAAAGVSFSLIVPIRLGLGATALVVALLAGAAPRSAVAGFVLGAALLAFAALADRRGALVWRSEPEPLPAGARREAHLRLAWRLMLPSTVALAALTAIAFVAGSAVLGAILGGALAGLGLAAAVTWVRLTAWQRERGVRLYFETTGGSRRFVEPRGERQPTA